MADDHPPTATEPPPSQAPLPLPPPPFITFPFPQMRPPPFWPMQDPPHPHPQFFGIRTLPPNVQFAVPDLHSHAQAAALPFAMQSGEGRGAGSGSGSSALAPRAAQFATRNFPPQHPVGDRQPSIPSLSSQNPAAATAGLQLFAESPESSLLDPQTASPPPSQSSRQRVAKGLPRVNPRAQTGQVFSGMEAAAAAQRQNGHQAAGVYPPPLASHQDVIADRQLFYDTLSKLHAFLALQPRVPKLGGKELDLHTLYREVTAHGGLKQVVKFNSWKEIMAALDLPARVSSFFIRKHYTNLLHHYEQVYYFRVQGQIVPPPAPLPTPSPSTSRINDTSKSPVAEDQVPAKRRRRKKFNPIETLGVDPGKSVGRSVTGAIEGKFEHGYLVTVVVGTEKMRGVLYHVPSGNDTPQFAALPELMNKLASPQNSVDSRVGIRRRRSKNGNYLKRDPNAPRSSRSGYNFFFAEQRTRLKDYRPEKHTEVTKIIGELWHQLTPEERMPYLQRGQSDKERYRSEKKEYQEKLKMQAELGDENAVQAHSESLDDPGHGPEQLAQDGDHEFGDANDSDHDDYHVSLDADLDTGAFNSSREQSLRTQVFGDYVPEDQIEYSQDQGYQIPERRDQDQEQRVYVAQPEDYEEEEDDDNDGEDGDGEDEGDDDGDDAQEDGQYASVEAHGF